MSSKNPCRVCARVPPPWLRATDSVRETARPDLATPAPTRSVASWSLARVVRESVFEKLLTIDFLATCSLTIMKHKSLPRNSFFFKKMKIFSEGDRTLSMTISSEFLADTWRISNQSKRNSIKPRERLLLTFPIVFNGYSIL